MLRVRRQRAVVAAFGALTMAIGAVTVSQGVQAGQGSIVPDLEAVPASTERHLYVVEMTAPPVVAYGGGVRGLPATQPAAGQKIDPTSAKVVKYVDYLDASHANALAKVGGRKVRDYRYSFNGFAAELTEADAAKLAGVPGIAAVTRNEIRRLTTADTPSYLGLDAAGGIWEQLGGPVPAKNRASAGDGVIVGIIDSGIWPENPSFADRDAAGKLLYQQIRGWHGKCTPGEQFAASMCNQKLIGAQWFNDGYGGDAGVKAYFPYEFASARDADGHGSHTASTAAGNYGVQTQLAGQTVSLSGMAPGARIAAYKVCWGNNGEGGCPTVDSVAAIDQAVADGVDVINYSISGSTTSFRDPVEIAFLYANAAGVFVAASAGNEGPGASTVAHNSPWLTTVAASTHDRAGVGSFATGDGTTYEGASLAAPVPSSPFVEAAAVAAAGADPGEVALCYPGTLDPATTTGKIVLCDRGVIARTDKSLAVQQAGGVGMILVNTSPSSVNADNHWVPTVHVSDVHYAALHAYAATPGATATILGSQIVTVEAPEMAAFSSRGPALAGAGDQLSPDITAPGVDVFAAVSPIGYRGRNFDFLSGTSMSSPHIAGIGALLSDLHPDWSPSAMRSAIQTSARQLTTGGNPFGDEFDYGAGEVVPNAAADPGLVYDATFDDYIGFLCGGDLGAGFCLANGFDVIDPSDLNQASVAIGALAGSQTVTRTVTNVGAATTYTASVDAPAGIDVQVSPSMLTLGAGQSAKFEVTFTTTPTAAIDEFAFGSLTWSDGDHSVRSPLVVRPVVIAAPEQVSSTGGPVSYTVGFGASGAFATAVRGLAGAAEIAGNVVDDPADDINVALGTGVGITVHAVPVPAGTSHLRLSLFDEETDGNDDLDLYLFNPGGAYVAGSGSGTSAEQIDVESPASGVWFAVVHGWQTDGPDANYTLFHWNVPATPAGNVTVTAPPTATLGTTAQVTLTFSGLTAGTKYLGAVDYSVDGIDGGSTVVRVDP